MSRQLVTRKRCCVPNCENNYENNPNIGYFSLPRSRELGEQWLQKINNPSLFQKEYSTLRSNYTVCGTHFTDSQFKTRERKKLNLKVVPTIFPENPRVSNKEQITTTTESSMPVAETVDRCRICLENEDQYTLTNITKQCYLKRTLKEVLLILVPDMVGSLSDTDCLCVNCGETLKRSAELIETCLTVEAKLKRCKNSWTELEKNNIQTIDTNYLDHDDDDDVNDNKSVENFVEPVHLSNLILNNGNNIHTQVESSVTTGGQCEKYDADCPVEGINSWGNRILILKQIENSDLENVVLFFTHININVIDNSTNIGKKRILLIGTKAPTKCLSDTNPLKYERNQLCPKQKSLPQIKKKRKREVCPKCNKIVWDCFMQAHLKKHDKDDERRVKMEKIKIMREHARLTCKTCSERFPNSKEFKCHLEIHPPYVCEQCGKGFIQKHYLKIHKDTHNDPNTFICEICGQGCKHTFSLRRHMRLHDPSLKFHCDLCPSSFTRKSRLINHRKGTHLGIKKYKCDICNQRFCDNSNLKVHYRIKHSEVKPFQCEKCGEMFGRSDYLKRHTVCGKVKRKSHTVRKSYTDHIKIPQKRRIYHYKKGDEALITCKLCDKAFRSIHLLKVHVRSHTKMRKYKCSMCNLRFTTNINRDRHEKVHTNSSKLYRCEICFKIMETQSELDEHCALSHEKYQEI